VCPGNSYPCPRPGTEFNAINPSRLKPLLQGLFSQFEDQLAVADANAVAAAAEAVGHPLRTFDAFVAELAG